MSTIRILHVLDSMDRGGIASWLMTVLRHIDRDRFQMDFLVHTDKSCAYDDEARDLGANIIPCPGHKNICSYALKFRRILKEYGPYDVLHGHCHRFSGLNLLLASRVGIPIRIAHSHNDLRFLAAGWGIGRRVYHSFMDGLIDRYATIGLAASRKAAEDLFGINWKSDRKWRILFCGIDFAPFRKSYNRAEVMAELGFSSDCILIAHVGRFTAQKNFPFILEVFAQALDRETRLKLVFIGDGDLLDDTQAEVARLGLTENVIFLGSRPDVPKLLVGIVDLFFFPSLYEGLGLALVEAQASGLQCLISENIPEEADVVSTLIRRISFSLPASIWADEIVKMLKSGCSMSRIEALNLVEQSPFNIGASLEELKRTYTSE